MKKQQFSIVEKLPITRMTQTVRQAALNHSKEANKLGTVKGLMISETVDGQMLYDIAGCTTSEAVAMLEEAKFCLLRDKWGIGT